MSDYKVHFLLPARLYNLSPFVYVGPDFRSLPLGIVSDIFTHKGKELQRLYPLTVSQFRQDGSQTDLLFCFTFCYINDDDKRVIFLTPPIKLKETGTSEALEMLLAEVEKLAKFIQSSTIEIEQHEQLNGSISFPTSLSFLSYAMSNMKYHNVDLRILEKFGYRKKEEVRFFECEISDYSPDAQDNSDKYDMKNISPNEFMEYKKSSRVFSSKSFSLSQIDDALKTRVIPYFEDTIHTARKRSSLRFKKYSTYGYMMWTPDLLEIDTPFPFLFLHSLEEMLFTRGNIFDWRLRNRDEILFNSLLSYTVCEMKKKGIQTVQFAYVGNGEDFVKACLVDRRFKENHNLILFRKELG